MKASITLMTLLLVGVLIYFLSPRDEKPTLNSNNELTVDSLDSRPQDKDREKPNTLSLIKRLTSNNQRWEIRLHELRNIDKDSLSQEDIDTLYSLLKYHPPSHEEEWWVIVNEIMEQLRVKGIERERYTAALVDVCTDPATHPVLKDYATQHLGHWLNPIGVERGEVAESNPDNIHLVLDTLTDLVVKHDIEDNSISGTSLLTILNLREHLAPEYMAPAVQKVSQWTESVVKKEKTVEHFPYVAAIRAAGDLGIAEVNPDLRNLVQNDSTAAMVRLASIVSLGSLGDSSDIPELNKLATSSSKFKHAARAAINNITHNTQ